MPDIPASTCATATVRTGLPPVADADTRLLLLGSFPSVASLAAGQYYAHPRNLFWPLLSAALGENLVALPYAQRLQRLQARGIGLWDVWASCRRDGSLDSAIRDPVPNDLRGLLHRCPRLQAIAHNGSASASCRKLTAAWVLQTYALPSSSPANAGIAWQRKLDAWRAVIDAHALPPRAAASAKVSRHPPAKLEP